MRFDRCRRKTGVFAERRSDQEMLRIDTWERQVPQAAVAPTTSQYVTHTGQTAAGLAKLVRNHSADNRCLSRVTGWLQYSRGGDIAASDEIYDVLGWTSAAVLRAALSARLDALSTVAAHRLLDQPEIEELGYSRGEYVVLRSRYGITRPQRAELAGAISAADLDLWLPVRGHELEHAYALEFGLYLRRFIGTEFAA